MPSFKNIGMIAGGLLLFVIIGGVGVKIVQPTSKTIVGQGGRVVNVNTEQPSVPLGGCSIYRINAKVAWQNSLRLQEKPEVKK